MVSEIDTGKFIDVNERWTEMLGYPRDIMIGRTSKDIGIWDDPHDRDRAIEKLKRDGRFQMEPIRFVSRSGEIRYALWSGEVISFTRDRRADL